MSVPEKMDSKLKEACLEVQFLHQYVEGELDPIRTGLMRQHLTSCAACQKTRDEIEGERLWLIETAVDAPALVGRFEERVQERIMERIRDELLHSKRQDSLQRQRALFARAASFAAAAALIALTAIQFEKTQVPLPVPRVSADVLTDSAAPPAAFPTESPALCSLDCSEALYPVSLSSSTGVPLIHRRAARGAAVREATNFGEVVGIAIQLTPSSLPAPPRDPCKPDPNKDGKMDLNDVAYSCQLLIGGPQPHSLELKDVPFADFPLVDSDCDDVCLRA